MEFEYYLASGLAVLIMGIAFFWNRISFIKKVDIAIATMFKREEFLDSESNKNYIPFFKFTTCNNKEIIYEHRSTQIKYQWRIGEKVKVAYRGDYFDDHDIVLLTFFNAFGLATLFLTVGGVLLITAGGIYWNASKHIFAYLIPGSIVVIISTLNIWANRFFNSLGHP